MKNISIWKESVGKSYPSLNSNKEVDVLIIGGGITGVNTLYRLKDLNLKVILVEQNKIGLSTSGNNTGKLSFLQNDLIDKIRNKCGDDKASLYLKSQIEAIDEIKGIIKKENISCDLEETHSYLYTNVDEEISILNNLKSFLEKNDIKVSDTYNDLVVSKYMIKVDHTYMFNPVKYIYGLLEKIGKGIYEDTSIKKIIKTDDFYICKTDKYEIKTKWVVLATHYPYFIIPYLFPLKSYLEKSYLAAFPYKSKKISLISYSNPFISFRTYKDNLIYLSNSHDIGTKVNDKKNYEELIKKVNDLHRKPKYLWSNIDVMTNDGLPYIGKIKDKMLIATGYNTWGLLSSLISADIIKDIILDKENKYISLFDPYRNSNFIDRLGNIGKSLMGIINGIRYKSDKISYKKIDGKKVLLYSDKIKNKNYIVLKKCPHMGCNLIFNEVEKTWDCPCHGSRYSLDGKVIYSPSNKSINVSKNN